MDDVENITKEEYLSALARKRTKGVSKGTPNNHGVSRSALTLNRSQTQPARYAAPSWGKFTHSSLMSSRSRKHFVCSKYLRVPQWQGGGDKVMNVIDCGGGGVAKEADKQVQPFGHRRKPTFQFDLNEPYMEEGSKSETEKPNGGKMIMPPKIEDEEEEDIASGFWAECPLLPFDEKIMSLPNPQMQEYLHLYLMNNNNTPMKALLQNPSPSISQYYNPTLQPYGLTVGIGSGLETNRSSSGNIVYDSPIKGLVKEGNLVIQPGGPGGARNGSSVPDGSAEFTFVHA